MRADAWVGWQSWHPDPDDGTREWERRHRAAIRQEQTDPLVWCQCFRNRIRLSSKNAGKTCRECKRSGA